MKSGRWQNELCAAAFVQQQEQNCASSRGFKGCRTARSHWGDRVKSKNNLSEICNKSFLFLRQLKHLEPRAGPLKKKKELNCDWMNRLKGRSLADLSKVFALMRKCCLSSADTDGAYSIAAAFAVASPLLLVPDWLVLSIGSIPNRAQKFWISLFHKGQRHGSKILWSRNLRGRR